jgi:DNA-binding response OmpR family regulator
MGVTNVAKRPPKRRALIVDDDDSIRFVIGRALTKAGWLVDDLDDGTAIDEMLEAHRYELIVLDLYMPGMNGYEVLRQVRGKGPELRPAWRTPPEVRIVVVSGVADESGMGLARRIGADACLSKPFDPAELVAAAER